jgi:hypothetical protein
MAKLRKTRSLQRIAALAGAIGSVVVIGYMYRVPSRSPVESPPVPVPAESRSANQADGNQASVRGPLLLGSVLGYNSPAPPPASISVGRSSEETGTADLSTPGTAVYSVLSLIDQGATGKLAPCRCGETGEPVSNLYPRYLGPPVGLGEVIEEGQSAKVVWDATVHTEFSRRDKRWTPGETITLTARLVRVKGLWRLQQLHEEDEDDPQSRDAPPN